MRRRREFFGICYLNCVPLGTPMLAPPPPWASRGGEQGGNLSPAHPLPHETGENLKKKSVKIEEKI